MQRGDHRNRADGGLQHREALAPPDSREAKSLAERRRLLEWRSSAAGKLDSSILPWTQNARARTRLAQMRLRPRERGCLHCPASGTQNGARAGGESPMIDLYYWPTPNGHKIAMFLEEMAMPYTIVPVNIGKGEQFKPEFLAISPNNRMPAIVDHSPLERGAPINGIRIRCNFAVPGGEEREIHSERNRAAGPRCCSGCSGRWRTGTDARTKSSFHALMRPSRFPTPSSAT